MNSSVWAVWAAQALREKSGLSFSEQLLRWFFQLFVGTKNFKNLKVFQVLFCSQKVEKITLKSCSEKLKSTFFSLTAWAAQTAQTEEFMFQNVA